MHLVSVILPSREYLSIGDPSYVLVPVVLEEDVDVVSIIAVYQSVVLEEDVDVVSIIAVYQSVVLEEDVDVVSIIAVYQSQQQ